MRYLFDAHVHTAEVSPCGRIPAAEMVRRYRDAGYHGIVITDHYHATTVNHGRSAIWDAIMDRYLTGYRIAREEGDRLGILVLLGLELTFSGPAMNDYLVYGVTEEFLFRVPRLCALGLSPVSALAREEGFLIYQAHPFRVGQKPAPTGYIDGMEVYNGNPRCESRNHRALEHARRTGLAMISGSDAHQVEDIGRGGFRLSEMPADGAGFVKLLRETRMPEMKTAGDDVLQAQFALSG